MSLTITADREFLGAWQGNNILSGARPKDLSTAGSRAAAPYLTFVWIAVALGVLAIFEPSPSDIGIAALIVFGFLNGNLRWNQKLTSPFMLLGLFMLANLVSLCYATDLKQGAAYFGITLFMIASWLFVVGLLGRYGEQGMLCVMSAFTIAGVVSATLAIATYFNLAPPLNDWLLFYDRIKGFFKDPNVFGPYLVIAAVYALHRLQLKAPLSRRLCWLSSFLIASLGVLLCYSRAAWVNYALTLLFFFGLNWIANRRTAAAKRCLVSFVLVSVIVSACLAYALTIPQVGEVVAYRTELQDYDADRFVTQTAALQLGFSNPLGVGPAQSFALLDYATHNLYLRIFSENGVLGFLSLAAFLLLTLARSLVLSFRARQPSQRAMFALITAAIGGTLLNSFTIDTLHWRHFWLLLALGWMPLWTSGTARRATNATALAPLVHTPELQDRDRNASQILNHAEVK
jgi:O-antigen ligase